MSLGASLIYAVDGAKGLRQNVVVKPPAGLSEIMPEGILHA